MNYIQAISELKKDHNKKFTALYDGDLLYLETETYEDPKNHYIIVRLGKDGSDVSYLNFYMIELDWSEEGYTKQEEETNMKTHKKELVNYLSQQTSLLEKIENEYAPLEASEAVKRLIDGETMAFLTSVDGHTKLYEVTISLETVMDMPRTNYRVFLITPNGRYERGMDKDEQDLGRLLRKEWYTKIYKNSELDGVGK